MSTRVISGWMFSSAGTVVWLWGYFTTGHPAFINWQAYALWWIADSLPNVESEIGVALMFAGMVPLSWPPGHN